MTIRNCRWLLSLPRSRTSLKVMSTDLESMFVHGGWWADGVGYKVSGQRETRLKMGLSQNKNLNQCQKNTEKGKTRYSCPKWIRCLMMLSAQTLLKAVCNHIIRISTLLSWPTRVLAFGLLANRKHSFRSPAQMLSLILHPKDRHIRAA